LRAPDDAAAGGQPSSLPAAVVRPYDTNWPAQFEAEQVRVEGVLRDWLVDGVHHVGSTAVPCMPAKPIIDMIAGVARLEDAELAEPQLTALGYRRLVHRVDAVLFNKAVSGVDTHHLHLTVPGSSLWVGRLAFREALGASAELRGAYAELKERLVADSGGRPYSAAGKRDFVRAVLAEVGVELQGGLYASGSGTPTPRSERG
jgi:GrpB-like predicted nucleotidyltransferase (UPF0157 family)